MTAPTPKDGLREGPPLNHEMAVWEAKRYSAWSNLSRCYLDLLAQRDAAIARTAEAIVQRDEAGRIAIASEARAALLPIPETQETGDV